MLTLTDKVFIFRNVLLEVIENLQFLIECDQSVKLVLQFNFLVFEFELELRVLPLTEHGLSEADSLCLSLGRRLVSLRAGCGLCPLFRA